MRHRKSKKKAKPLSAPGLIWIGNSAAWSEEAAKLQFQPLYPDVELIVMKMEESDVFCQFSVFRRRK